MTEEGRKRETPIESERTSVISTPYLLEIERFCYGKSLARRKCPGGAACWQSTTAYAGLGLLACNVCVRLLVAMTALLLNAVPVASTRSVSAIKLLTPGKAGGLN
jgi:hypothetical protein